MYGVIQIVVTNLAKPQLTITVITIPFRSIINFIELTKTFEKFAKR